MPGMDGLEATKKIIEQAPDTAVLIFTAFSERSLLARGLESGAKGYILKEAPHETLLRAIERVATGEGYVDPALMPAFLRGKEAGDMLTAREREILQLLADGMSNADVAAKLFISQETVKSHVRHILTKLEADTRTHAVAIALRDVDHRLRTSRAERSRAAAGRAPQEERERVRLFEQLIAAEQDERRRLALLPPRRRSAVALRDRADARRGRPRDRGRAGYDDAQQRARRRARAAPRDDPVAARPLVQPRAGRAPRPGVRPGRARARRPGSGSTERSRSRSTSRPAKSSPSARRSRFYQLIREALDQAVGAPADRISVRSSTWRDGGRAS